MLHREETGLGPCRGVDLGIDVFGSPARPLTSVSPSNLQSGGRAGSNVLNEAPEADKVEPPEGRTLGA
jgi:hypothetical protein